MEDGDLGSMLVNAQRGPWFNVGQCSTTCGAGLQEQNRLCTPPTNGGQPCPAIPSEQFLPCNRGSCPSTNLF